MKKFFNEFKKFISRGNVVDLAVGVIIGGAFTAIVTALTNKIFMPVINWILMLIVGGNGMDSIYTFLSKVYQTDADGHYILNEAQEKVIDLANSIYIDWGAFIIAVINFLLIAFVLFLFIKALNRAQDVAKKSAEAKPTEEERKLLKEKGIDMKNRKAVLEATKALREEQKAKAEAEALANKKPTTEEILLDIKNLLENK